MFLREEQAFARAVVMSALGHKRTFRNALIPSLSENLQQSRWLTPEPAFHLQAVPHIEGK